MSEPDDAADALGPAGTALSYALVVLLTVLLAVWGAFLVPFRVAGVLVPVCWVLAVAGNTALCLAGGRLGGRAGAAVPGLLWVVVAFTLGSPRAEGDLVVPGTPVGLVFLLLGVGASAVAVTMTGRLDHRGRGSLGGGQERVRRSR